MRARGAQQAGSERTGHRPPPSTLPACLLCPSMQLGLPGGGGEYEVVDGFGWTNGAVLDLLQRGYAANV